MRRCLVIGVLLLLPALFSMGMDTTTEDQIKGGLEAGTEIVDFVSKLGEATEKFFDAAGKMAGFLGAAGGLISFILAFIPKGDSPELKFMKQKFAEVNTKLDRITLEFDNVKDLITFENQRSVYVKEASKIIFGFQNLNKFINEISAVKCSSKKTCRRMRIRIAERYVKHFNIDQAFFTIMHGSTKQTSVFGEPLLALVRKTFKCTVSKIDLYANGILKLAFKAQQVMLAHEMLTGSNETLVASVKNWLDNVYSLRETADKQKNTCYDYARNFMLPDLRDSKYQTDVSSNSAAVKAVKSDMEKKYNWLRWVVYSYNAWGADNHYITCRIGGFWSMPVPKEKRKRNIVAIPQGKGGYGGLKIQFSNSISFIARYAYRYMFPTFSAKKILNVFERKLRQMDTWKLVKSFSVLTNGKKVASSITSHSMYWYNEEVTIHGLGYGHHLSRKFRIIAVFRSKEEIESGNCRLTCSGNGQCRVLPFSATSICQCKPDFQGRNCEQQVKAKLAVSIENLLKTTLRIPQLSDVFFAVKDLEAFLGSSIGRVLSAISILGNKVQESFLDLNRKLTNQFQWSNLLTMYSNTLKSLINFSHELNRTNNNPGYQINTTAQKILEPNGVAKWLYDLNFLFVGRSDLPPLTHKSLMEILMEKHAAIACSATYIKAIDVAWKQLELLQLKGFLMWEQARGILSLATDTVDRLYTLRQKGQKSILDSLFCSMNIKNSNINCPNKGHFLYKKMKLTLKCKPNYYVKGSLTVSCGSKSVCSNCNCNIQGSSSRQCKDISGQCTCKNKYFGKRCANRNCQWRVWTSWSGCTRSCGYGGTQIRTRTVFVTRKGSGKRCIGNPKESRTCPFQIFKRCCSGQFHCSNRRKCIAITKKCDYNNDCGDNQDEKSCPSPCSWRYTPLNAEGGGNMVYLDRHHPICPTGYAMNQFALQRSGGRMRYRYFCCGFQTRLYHYRRFNTGFTYDGGGNMVYLDRQSIDCGSHGVLQGFYLNRNSGHNHVRYTVTCGSIKPQYWKRTTCYMSVTGFTYDGNGKVYYLDRQNVRCNTGYFLSYVRLERNGAHNHVRYRIRCCMVKHY